MSKKTNTGGMENYQRKSQFYEIRKKEKKLYLCILKINWKGHFSSTNISTSSYSIWIQRKTFTSKKEVPFINAWTSTCKMIFPSIWTNVQQANPLKTVSCFFCFTTIFFLWFFLFFFFIFPSSLKEKLKLK